MSAADCDNQGAFLGGEGGGGRRGVEWGIEIFHDVLPKYLLIISRIRLLID